MLEKFDMEQNPDVQPLSFTMNLKLNVGLTIEDLVLHSRLGLIDESLTIVREALWQHLLFFPAFAEVMLFLIAEDKIHEARSILELLHHQNYSSVFTPAEISFVESLEVLRHGEETTLKALTRDMVGYDTLSGWQSDQDLCSPTDV